MVLAYGAEKATPVNLPTRVCRNCGKDEQLTTERFYAEFGRMPW